MENIIIIKDKTLGVLNGRDCIYIDSVTQNNSDNLIFRGEINGNLASNINEDKWIPYKLTFNRVLTYFSCELDTYENIDNSSHLYYSDFNLIENSNWLKHIPIRKDFDSSIFRHYQLFTYDYVYNIIAVSYDIECNLADSKLII